MSLNLSLIRLSLIRKTKSMKTIAVTSLIFLCIAMTTTAIEPSTVAKKTASQNPQIDYPGFVNLANDVRAIRQQRRIPIETFNEMARDKDTIILDTRSKAAFDATHVKGAIHLNFSDFTASKLAKVIPSKNTRILIYCNNNFVVAKELMPQLESKGPRLALNIPTFVNLHGYGYKNVYELADALKVDDKRIELVGTQFESDHAKQLRRKRG